MSILQNNIIQTDIKEEVEKKRLLQIPGMSADHIYICSGGIDIRQAGNNITPSSFGKAKEGDSSQSLGGKYRALAAVHINNLFPDKTYHTSAYQVLPAENQANVTHASIYADYLRKRGIESIQEHSDTRITNTFSEILNIARIIRDQGINNISILSSGYHQERVKAMIEILFYNRSDQNNKRIQAMGGIRNAMFQNVEDRTGLDCSSIITPEEIDNLIKGGVTIEVLSDEEILQNSKFNNVLKITKREVVDTIENNETSIKKRDQRLEAEKTGVSMLYEGTYWISEENKKKYFNQNL